MGQRPIERLSIAQARRVALSAQGFGQPRPSGVPTRRDLRRVLKHTGLLQIDSVNVLARAHYLPLFSRLGEYPPALLENAAYRNTVRQPRELFEYWGHEASLIPVADQPLFRWRMAEVLDHAWEGMKQIAEQQPELVRRVLQAVHDEGPVSAGDLAKAHEGGRSNKKGQWWDWDVVKTVLEFLFWSGEVTTASRRGFERMYDIPERVLPGWVLGTATPSRDDAQRELMLRAASSLGVATERDLRDYYRLSVTDARARLGELVEAGDLEPVGVHGWKRPAFIRPGLKVPRRVSAAALVSPFDPLVWERDRTERLFGFRYRIEIYVPAHKRVHGYYVLPFLMDEQLAARVDLKADRQTRQLRVQAAFLEAHAPEGVPERLANQLLRMAAWLGLDEVVVNRKGDLAPALARSFA